MKQLSKVDDFGTNRKRVCDFLLVFHCDYGPILHRYGDLLPTFLLFGDLAPYVRFGISR